jgi:tetratricopeptide (TPR) repeat protein
MARQVLLAQPVSMKGVRVLMKKKITSIWFLILGTAVVMGQVNTPAIQELHAGARSFQEGKFAEAQQHFERAGKLDPNYKYAQLLLARSLQGQYRPGDQSPANLVLARKAITAYKNYLLVDSKSEIAFYSVAVLYGSLAENEMQRLWILDQAKRESVPKEQRAECYIVLASKAWSCSFFQAEKTVVTKQCVVDGLRLIESALVLDPDNSLAWLYKGELLSEMAKSTESVAGTMNKAHYEKLAADAKRHSRELKAKHPTEETGTHRRIITGDEQLDAILSDDFSLTYLAAPIPLSPEPLQ